jgi:hypothetical protein
MRPGASDAAGAMSDLFFTIISFQRAFISIDAPMRQAFQSTAGDRLSMGHRTDAVQVTGDSPDSSLAKQLEILDA